MQFEHAKVDPGQLPPTVLSKWSAGVLDEGFVPFPKRLLRCLATLFSGSAALEQLAVILAIADYRRPRPYRSPSLARLAFTADMEEEAFLKHLLALQKRGWLKAGGTPDALEIELDGLLAEIVKTSSTSTG